MIAFARSRPRLFRAVFFFYALAVLVATHWPRLSVPGAQAGSDKLAHFAAFFLWTLLAFAAGLFAPAFSRRNTLLSVVLALVYGTLDELSQLIPVFGRQFAVADTLANAAGVGAAYALARMVIRPEPEEPVKNA